MRALVSGAPGQDAAWMANFLLDKGYKVIVTYRYSSTDFKTRFKNYPLGHENFQAVCYDIIDPSSCTELINQYNPDEIYNLAAASHVGESFKNPSSVFDINTKAVINWLEAIRKTDPSIRFLQASTSEMWGSNYSTDKGGTKYQDENTPFCGNSPYAISKIAAHNMVKLYRDSYGLFCCSSICHNHESKFRGENFVTRKITKWVAQFYRWRESQGQKVFTSGINKLGDEPGEFPKLRLGNVDAVRDWSHAKDFVRGMWMMLQAEEADDYVMASGVGRSVRDFLKEAFKLIGVDNYEDYYVVDPQFYRPCEVEFLQGRATKIREKLGWEPQISFQDLAKEMVEYDIDNTPRL